MIKPSLNVTLFIVLISSLIQIQGCKEEITDKEYLQSVYEALDKIKSATYYITGSVSAPGDTLSFSEMRYLYIKEFVNPDDEFVGASSLQYNREDTTRIIEFYDGFVKGKYYWEEKTIRVDSFQNYPYPFRLVYFPFYTKTKSIIQYMMKYFQKESTFSFVKEKTWTFLKGQR